ncbi:hypothetical protein ACJ2A9_07800 [Anaerobacillus sp. MEB173]
MVQTQKGIKRGNHYTKVKNPAKTGKVNETITKEEQNPITKGVFLL